MTDTPENHKLPTEPGSAILVTEWKGKKLAPPIQATLDVSGMWVSLKQFPGGFRVAYPDEITGFRPARTVTEEGE